MYHKQDTKLINMVEAPLNYISYTQLWLSNENALAYEVLECFFFYQQDKLMQQTAIYFISAIHFRFITFSITKSQSFIKLINRFRIEANVHRNSSILKE